MDSITSETAGYIGGGTVVLLIVSALLYRYNPFDMILAGIEKVVKKIGWKGVLAILIIVLLTLLVLLYIGIIKIPGLDIPEIGGIPQVEIYQNTNDEIRNNQI
jgi:hypothetical membrane protein